MKDWIFIWNVVIVIKRDSKQKSCQLWDGIIFERIKIVERFHQEIIQKFFGVFETGLVVPNRLLVFS